MTFFAIMSLSFLAFSFFTDSTDNKHTALLYTIIMLQIFIGAKRNP